MCGHPLHKSDAEIQKCPDCGSMASPVGADKCVACGRSFGTLLAASAEINAAKSDQCEHWSETPAHEVRTAKIGMAAILILLAGSLGITHALLSVLPNVGSDILSKYEDLVPPGKVLNGILGDYVLVAAMMFLTGVLAIACSMFAFMRTNFWGAMAGGVLGILAIGFLFGAFFALVGIILLATSKREFLAECA